MAPSRKNKTINSGSSKGTAQTAKAVFPPIYQFLFMVLEPAIIHLSLLTIIASPANFIASLSSPISTGTGLMAVVSPLPKALTLTSPATVLSSPQGLVLIQQFMGALFFSAVIEPLVLYVAAYRLESAKDVERVVGAVLVAFMAFDFVHSAATLSVVGWEAVLPEVITGVKGGLVVLSCVNVWVPMLWAVLRGCWLAGLGREKAVQDVGMKQKAT